MRNVDPNHEKELKKVTTGKIIEGQESGFLPFVPIEEGVKVDDISDDVVVEEDTDVVSGTDVEVTAVVSEID